MPAMIDIPLDIVREPSLPPTARQLHGAVSTLLQESPEDHRSPVKAFAAWPLHSAEHEPDKLRVRLGWLADGPAPRQLTTNDQSWRIGSLVARASNPSATRLHFANLAATPPADAIRFHFHTPTLFSRSGRKYPLPDPVLILRSVSERWNTFAGPLAIEEPSRRAFLEDVELVDFDIKPERMLVDRAQRNGQFREHWRLGFIGAVQVGLPPKAERWKRGVMAALARYAEVSGVGYATTEGFGACSTQLIVDGEAMNDA